MIIEKLDTFLKPYFDNIKYISNVDNQKEIFISGLKDFTLKQIFLLINLENNPDFSLEQLLYIYNYLLNPYSKNQNKVFSEYIKAIIDAVNMIQQSKITLKNSCDKNLKNKTLITFSDIGVLDNIIIHKDANYYDSLLLLLDVFKNSLMEEKGKTMILK